MFRPQQERSGLRSLARSRMRDPAWNPTLPANCARWMGHPLMVVALAAWLYVLLACSSRPDPNTLVMIIESSPTNLDPRVGIDAQSENIDSLMFDALLRRDDHLNVAPGLAEKWETPDPLTYVFHLHPGVKFHDGQPLTSRDVKWTFDSLLQGKVRSTKSSAYRFVDRVEAIDDYTVVIHMKEPDATLLWNISGGAIGIVPYGSGPEMSTRPIGSGPFRFVSAQLDKDVVIERNPNYWDEKPRIDRVRFMVVPDTTTRALELRKGSADIAINALNEDMIGALEREPNLQLLHGPGTRLGYLAFNTRDPILKDVRVRRAIAYAIDRHTLIQYLLRDFARPAASVLPPESWAYDSQVQKYPHDPARARKLLDAAGYAPTNGIRFHLAMKTSTEESSRLLATVLQQQLREVGIALDIRSFEFATFFADVTRGEFQVHSLRWIGADEDPDIFKYAFHSAFFTPNGANRTFYANPLLDVLIDQARRDSDQDTRKQLYAQVQQILAEDVPYVNLWYFDNLMVASRRVRNLRLNPSGNYDFLRTAELTASR